MYIYVYICIYIYIYTVHTLQVHISTSGIVTLQDEVVIPLAHGKCIVLNGKFVFDLHDFFRNVTLAQNENYLYTVWLDFVIKSIFSIVKVCSF
jgi:hypothetical protein